MASMSPEAAPPPGLAPPQKRRSCVTCRTRKVRCDKLSPCSNCRRAQIDCIFPSADRPPRWARRLERLNQGQEQQAAPENAAPAVGQVMERLRTLESLVKELSGQLEHANAASASGTAPLSDASSHVNSPRSSGQGAEPDHHMEDSTSSASIQKQFGRLVLQDASKSRYVSSGFWSRVTDEVSSSTNLRVEVAGRD